MFLPLDRRNTKLISTINSCRLLFFSKIFRLEIICDYHEWLFIWLYTFWSFNINLPVDCAISQGQNSPSASLVINSIVMRLRKRVSPTWVPTTWKSWTSRRNLSRSSPRSTMHFWPPSLLSSKFPGFWDLVLTKLANSLLCLLTETTLMKRSKTCRAPSNSRWRRYKQFQHKK